MPKLHPIARMKRKPFFSERRKDVTKYQINFKSLKICDIRFLLVHFIVCALNLNDSFVEKYLNLFCRSIFAQCDHTPIELLTSS